MLTEAARKYKVQTQMGTSGIPARNSAWSREWIQDGAIAT